MLTALHITPGSKNAIVYVHGFTGDPIATWNDIPARHAADPRLRGWDHCSFGYESSAFFDLAGLWSADARIEEIATMLDTTLTGGPQTYDAVALVAHSMGGLVVQQALVRSEALRRKASHVIFFGTPSRGLVKAHLLSFWKRQVRNMAATGDFICELRRAWDGLHLSDGTMFKLLTVAGESDQFVPPESSLMAFPEAARRVISGNHLTMIRAKEGEPCAAADLITALVVGDAAAAGPRTAAAVALEQKEFQRVIGAYWSTRTDLDARAAVSLAIALDSVGRRDDAMSVLQPHCASDADVIGTLAGRIKRRWLVERRRSDADEALRLYGRGFELASHSPQADHAQAYYHATNLAFMHMAYGGDVGEASRFARETIRHAEAAPRSAKAEHWRLASLGDAHLVLGDCPEALEYHQQAMQERVSAWQALSSQEQALRLADLRGVEDDVIRRLAAIYVAGRTVAGV
jgi:pimeloyl-ACP methyl ester carboxylesterase